MSYCVIGECYCITPAPRPCWQTHLWQVHILHPASDTLRSTCSLASCQLQGHPLTLITTLVLFLCKHLTLPDQISSLSKSCYSHICELSCIRPYLDSKTASTIAASIVHSKLDYCNSLSTTVFYGIDLYWADHKLSSLQYMQTCINLCDL